MSRTLPILYTVLCHHPGNDHYCLFLCSGANVLSKNKLHGHLHVDVEEDLGLKTMLCGKHILTWLVC